MVAGIVHFAAETSATVIAEGVETVAEAAAVQRLGIRLAQGHLYAPALPIERAASIVITPPVS